MKNYANVHSRLFDHPETAASVIRDLKISVLANLRAVTRCSYLRVKESGDLTVLAGRYEELFNGLGEETVTSW